MDIITSADSLGGGYVINGFVTGEWLAYTINVATTGSYVIGLRASHNYSVTPSFHIEIDGKAVTGIISVPKTGSWSIFQWVNTPTLTLAAGRHVLKIVTNQNYFNLNSVRVTAAP